jgi:hypothetical protein
LRVAQHSIAAGPEREWLDVGQSVDGLPEQAGLGKGDEGRPPGRATRGRPGRRVTSRASSYVDAPAVPIRRSSSGCTAPDGRGCAQVIEALTASGILNELAKLLRAERRARGTRKGTRLLTCFRQALLVLVWMRTKGEVEVIGAGFGVPRATAYRYRDEAFTVLAAQAPDLHEALQEVAEQGWSHVVVDGKLIRTDRCAETTTSVNGETINAWYSGKHHAPGGNVQAVIRPDGVTRHRSRITARRPGRRPAQHGCRLRVGLSVTAPRCRSSSPATHRFAGCSRAREGRRPVRARGRPID